MIVDPMLILKNHLNIILDFIEDKNDVVYIDYPVHHNIGDLLIFIGTLEFLRENRIKSKKNLNIHNFDIEKLNKIITPRTTILCHGGGNFGDIYIHHQELREKMVRSFSNNRIIVLPQTAFFKEQVRLEMSKKIFAKHKKIVLFARDQASYRLFKEFSTQTYLVPDMAHQLYNILPVKKKPDKDILYFFRKDIEQNSLQRKIASRFNVSDLCDWQDLLSKKDDKILSIIFKCMNSNKRLKLNLVDDFVYFIWKRYSYRLASKYSKLFSSYDEIITSRLHGHILSCLVGTPSKLIDNSYGKNKAYYDIWTSNFNYTDFLND